MNSFILAQPDIYPQGSYRDVVDYVQEVIFQDPNDIYYQVGKPTPGRMPGSVTGSVNRLVPSSIPRRVHVGNDPDDGKINMTGVIKGALMDTRDFLRDCFDTRFNDITPETAARIIHAPETLHVLAGLALQAGAKDGETADMTPNYRRSFGINQDMTAIEMGPIFITEKNRGCPFAGKNGEIKPTPIFKELGLWAGTLATQAYFNHFHHVDPTEALRAYEQ